MSDILEEIKQVVNDRTKIWNKYDSALKEVKKLDQYQKFDNPNATLPSISLNKTNTPPDEIAEINWQLQEQNEKIKKYYDKIKQYQEEIEQNQKQFWIVIGIVIFIIFLLLKIILNSF